ncbi:MAG: acetylornithine transaminase [Proteobacteria bacterium]|jgi:acetylornithine/N-succinyldiaminopimelate aminotransferase|nr:acetylornithine transaminase [Pseudomonadota bacterium]MBT5065890.1 acetylornithine transaminase [Pseudomonadota bacterium]MBT6192655.1 acetylornithine transaminase [Pseudomonadota bacterium]MBT6464214.1 acetylornithine transaminase [Pseudomonadota bacterium]MBT6673816.1 acetylornithine transaminase [Pseudomonadota bacterium]
MHTSTTSSLMSNYGRPTITFERGEGSRLYSIDGREFIDALSGIAVCGLGHAHPEIRETLCTQAGKLVHTSNLYGIGVQEELADNLTKLSGMHNAFFCNSGAEANEAAIKIARKYGHQRGISDPTIVCMYGSFHGRTMGALSATGNAKVHENFSPLLGGFEHIEYGNINEAKSALEKANCVALMVEPIQGEGGVVIPSRGYLTRLRELCDENNALLILDEVQSGIGRTGKWFAFQHEKLLPDVLTVAKALGNGVPIGACLAKGAASEVLSPGTHGSTFGGNPLACSAALKVLEIIQRDSLLDRAAKLGRLMVTRLNDVLSDVDGVVEVRGKGLMLGITIDRPCAEIVNICFERGLLINVTAGNVVRLLPPLILSDETAETIAAGVAEAVVFFLSKNEKQIGKL